MFDDTPDSNDTPRSDQKDARPPPPKRTQHTTQVMLLVMLYEAAIFIAVLLGLAAGYFLFELLTAM